MDTRHDCAASRTSGRGRARRDDADLQGRSGKGALAVSGLWDLPRMLGTVLALLSGYLIWRGSDVVVELLQWPDLLPVVRLCAIVLGVSCLEVLVQRLRRLLPSEAQAPTTGNG